MIIKTLNFTILQPNFGLPKFVWKLKHKVPGFYRPTIYVSNWYCQNLYYPYFYISSFLRGFLTLHEHTFYKLHYLLLSSELIIGEVKKEKTHNTFPSIKYVLANYFAVIMAFSISFLLVFLSARSLFIFLMVYVSLYWFTGMKKKP